MIWYSSSNAAFCAYLIATFPSSAIFDACLTKSFRLSYRQPHTIMSIKKLCICSNCALNPYCPYGIQVSQISVIHWLMYKSSDSLEAQLEMQAFIMKLTAVNCGMFSRMSLPSLLGAKPRSDTVMPLSMAFKEAASYGWMTSMLLSGTDIPASCLSGVGAP